jgi:hypothetical protein
MNRTFCVNTNGDIADSPFMALTRICKINLPSKYHILTAILNLLPSEVLGMMQNVRHLRIETEKVAKDDEGLSK